MSDERESQGHPIAGVRTLRALEAREEFQ
jgi:hypothetical protein